MLIGNIGLKYNNSYGKSINFGSFRYPRVNGNSDSSNNMQHGFVVELSGRYSDKQLKVISVVIDKLSKCDFEDSISDLSRYGSFGNTQAAIGINYSNGKAKDVSVVCEDKGTKKTVVSIDDFTKILKTIKNLAVSKNLSKSEQYNRLYNEYIQTPDLRHYGN